MINRSWDVLITQLHEFMSNVPCHNLFSVGGETPNFRIPFRRLGAPAGHGWLWRWPAVHWGQLAEPEATDEFCLCIAKWTWNNFIISIGANVSSLAYDHTPLNIAPSLPGVASSPKPHCGGAAGPGGHTPALGHSIFWQPACQPLPPLPPRPRHW